MQPVTDSNEVVTRSLWSMGNAIRRMDDVEKLAPGAFAEMLDSLESEASTVVSFAPRGSAEYDLGRRVRVVVREMRKLFQNALDLYERSVARQLGVLRTLVESHPGTAMKIPAKHQARVAAVYKVLATLHTAAKTVKVGYKVTVNGHRGGTDTREGEVTVPLSDNYHTFLLDVFAAVEKDAGGGFDLDDFDEKPTLLRTFMEAHEPVKHPATAEFYNWVESPLGAGVNWRTGFGKQTQRGFAHTPYTFDYYKSTDDFLNAYGYVYIDDPNLYEEDEEGDTTMTPKSDEEQAEAILSYLDPDNHTSGALLHVERGLFENDDYFLVGYA